MEQKYVVALDKEKNRLTIREYAALEKEIFSLLYEETYDTTEIETAIENGETAVLDALRTPTLYPVRSNAQQLARCVLELFQTDDPQTMEIFIDEKDLLRQQEEEMEETLEGLAEDNTEELDQVTDGDSASKTSEKPKRQKQTTESG